MKNNFNKAFTLVELIVVITILAVLATVAFISFQGYTSSSRDSVRLADLKNISKSFEINRTKGIDFPLPDKKVDISSSGTIFQYQGELSPNILKSDLSIFDGGVDPLTGENYGYAVNSARNKFQVIGFLENSQNLANISLNKTFADNSDKYVKSTGDILGILLDENTNDLIVDNNSTGLIDLQTNTTNYAIFVDKEVRTGGNEVIIGEIDFRFNKIKDCRAILLNGNSQGNGIYTISPTGIEGEEFDVYCDMKNDGGGWTKISTEIPNDAYRLKLLDLVELDPFTSSQRDNTCWECGEFPQYIKISDTGHNNGTQLENYICKEKLSINRSYINIETFYGDDTEGIVGKNGMFLYDRIEKFSLRSESQVDYSIKKEIYCR